MSQLRILLLSDSHQLTAEVDEIIQRHRQDVDLIFHCGDSELPSGYFSELPIHLVRGNCDFEAYPEEIIAEYKGWKMFATHGHLNQVNESLVRLSYRAEEIGAKLVFFGHTHVAMTIEENGVVYVNPGSIRQPRQTNQKSYAVVDCDDRQVVITFYDPEGNEVRAWTKTYSL